MTDTTSTRPPPRRDWLVLTAFILAAFGASAIGSLTGTGTTDWYRTIAKPEWTPPGWLFGPVWTVLYFTIGISGWLVWRKSGFRVARTAMVIFAIQLILNAAWSPAFFGLQRPDIALGIIGALWLSIVAMIATFRHHDRRAAWLLVPYLLWVSFASTLNFAIMRLNP